jgi:hypothetical protein
VGRVKSRFHAFSVKSRTLNHGDCTYRASTSRRLGADDAKVLALLLLCKGNATVG